MTLLYT